LLREGHSESFDKEGNGHYFKEKRLRKKGRHPAGGRPRLERKEKGTALAQEGKKGPLLQRSFPKASSFE